MARTMPPLTTLVDADNRISLRTLVLYIVIVYSLVLIFFSIVNLDKQMFISRRGSIVKL